MWHSVPPTQSTQNARFKPDRAAIIDTAVHRPAGAAPSIFTCRLLGMCCCLGQSLHTAALPQMAACHWGRWHCPTRPEFAPAQRSSATSTHQTSPPSPRTGQALCQLQMMQDTADSVTASSETANPCCLPHSACHLECGQLLSAHDLRRCQLLIWCQLCHQLLCQLLLLLLTALLLAEGVPCQQP
jgi:hypothetical protein